MTAKMKMLLSILLSLVLGVGGYFGTRQIITGGENSGPRDNTKFTPVNFTWNEPKTNDNENSRFLAGKYVRNDGNAVLYIDYEDSRDYFNFELFVMAAVGKAEFQLREQAYIDSADGGTASYYYGTVTFEHIEQGVLELNALLDSDTAPADGTYYIEKAKYVVTPKPKVSPSPGPKPSPPQSGEDPSGGGTVSPSPSPSPSPDDDDNVNDIKDKDGDNDNEVYDTVGEPDPGIKNDAPGKTDWDLTPKTSQELTEHILVDGWYRPDMDFTNIGAYLQGKRVSFTGTSTVRYDYKLDAQIYRDFLKNVANYPDRGIEALYNFALGGGFVGDTVKTEAVFDFYATPHVMFDMEEGEEHRVGDYIFYINDFGNSYTGLPVNVPGLIWNSSEGYLFVTLESGKTLSVSLCFGRAPDGTVIAHGVGIAADESTTRKVYEINLTAVSIEDAEDWSMFEGVWLSDGKTDNDGNYTEETTLMEMRDGRLVRYERNGKPLTSMIGSLVIEDGVLKLKPDDGGAKGGIGAFSFSADGGEMTIQDRSSKAYTRVYRRIEP